MKTTASAVTLDAAAREVGVRVNGTPGQFTLKTLGAPVTKYGRRSQHATAKNGTYRRVPGAVCWHGHRDFMRAVFRLEPMARLQSALADYRGAEDFERKYRATYGLGNNYNLAYGQACDCLEEGTLP